MALLGDCCTLSHATRHIFALVELLKLYVTMCEDTNWTKIRLDRPNCFVKGWKHAETLYIRLKSIVDSIYGTLRAV